MLCPRCNKNLATVHIYEIEDFVGPGDNRNKVETHDLCEVCAQGSGLATGMPGSLMQAMAGVGLWNLLKGNPIKVHVTHQSAQPGPTCEECGMTLVELQRKGRVGCERDYEVFSQYLNEVLTRMHGANKHVGRLPGVNEVQASAQEHLGDLRRALELAIRKEDYERAADLRDEVAAAESDLEPSGGSEDRGQDPA
jgi:protein arginine kinase activator